MSASEPLAPAPRRERLLVALLCVAVSAAVVVPFHFMGRAPGGGSPWRVRMPDTHDVAMHFDHMRSFYRGLAAGRLYPRWQEEANRGFGAPSTSFHPPAIYYLTSLVHAVVRDWGLTFLLTHLVAMIASAAAFYRYARESLSRPSAAVAMVAYVVFPYHLLDLYHRGAMAESLAFVWMPLVWLFAERLLTGDARHPRLLNMAGLAAAYGAFLWSHPPTCYQFTLALGPFAAALAAGRRDPAGLASVAAALALGLGISAAYFYPAVVEQGLVRREAFRSVWAYHDVYVLSPQPAGTPPGFWALVNETWLFGVVGLALGAAALLARGGPPPGLRQRAFAWTVVGVFVAFMMTAAASPLERLPGLEMTSFPWRMLSISTLALALLAGASAEAAAGGRGGLRVLTAVLVLGGAAFSAVLVAAPRWGAASFQPREARPPADVFWMIPAGAPDDARALPQMEPAVLARGTGRVSVERWDPEQRTLAVDLPASDRLLVRTFDFPGWTATLDGRPATIEQGAALRNIEIALPPGAHRVALEFRATPARRLGAAVTLASVLVCLAAALRRGQGAGATVTEGATGVTRGATP